MSTSNMNPGLQAKSPPTFEFSVGHSTRRAKWKRRVKTLPGLIVAFFLTWLLLPALLVVAGVHDLVRNRRFSTTRLILFGAWWLAMELLGVFTAFLFWLTFAPFRKLDSKYSRRCHSHLQRLWARSLARGAQFTIGFQWSAEGTECLHSPGAIIVLARHGSQGDALLTAALLSGERRRLRFVLKRQLLADPCLDVVGHRIPNYFVDRDSRDNSGELANIGSLAADLESDEALVIFPEGTRFSPQKLTAALASLSQTAPSRVTTARNLRSVLPLRTAGTLAALAASDADIVICNHVGVDDISSLRHLRDSVPLENPLKFKLWRTSRDSLPEAWSEDQLVQWLDNQWLGVDQWVTANDTRPSPDARH